MKKGALTTPNLRLYSDGILTGDTLKHYDVEYDMKYDMKTVTVPRGYASSSANLTFFAKPTA